MRQTQTQIRTIVVTVPASESELHPYDRSYLTRTDRIIARIEKISHERTSR